MPTKNIVIKYVVDDSQLLKARTRSQEAQKATDELRKSTDNYGKSVKQVGKDGQEGFTAISKAIKTISFVLVAKELLDFTKQVIAVRGEFQKFEAVLTNTLGSRSAALIALGRINEFARSTPFGVKELTDNFIKLANRGIEPTVKQMRAIADLSATLGKDFSQVVEAILDINNPERWKEIGIKAETAGNKVKLTFRGVTEEVDRTVQGVTDAVVALGQLNGVAGSTEAISKTLAGQTSNLNDAWEQLLNTIGKGNEGVLFQAVGLLSKAIDKANELLKSPGQIFDETSAKVLAAEVSDFEKLASVLGDTAKAQELFLQKRADKLKEISDAQEKLINLETETPQQVVAKEKELARLRDLYDIYSLELPKAIDQTIEKLNKLNNSNSTRITVRPPTFDAKMTQEEYLKFKKEFERLAEMDPANMKIEISEEDMKKIQQDAFEFMSGELAKDDLPPLELGDILFGNSKEGGDSLSKAWEKEWKGFLQQGIDDTNNFIMGVKDAEIQGYEVRLFNLRNFYNEQQVLAGDNERAKKELRIKEERDVIALQKKIALAEWEAKRNSIILSTAAGIARAFIDYQWPYALIPAAAVAAQGGVQLGIANKSKPRFATGVIDLKGPGTETSDSIDAKLSRGESVMTAKQTREAFGILTDIRAGRLNDKVIRQIVNNGGAQMFSDDRIVSAIKSQPKPPDLVRQGRQLIEVHTDQQANKRMIRSKSMG